MEREHGEEPADREGDEAPEGDAPDPVEGPERRVRDEKGAHRPGERSGRKAQEERPGDRSDQAGDRQPGRIVRDEVRSDDRAQNGADRQSCQGERLGGEAPVRSQNGEGRDPEQQQNVDDVHADSLRSARGQASTTRLTSLPGTTISLRISLPSTWACTRGSSFARSTSSGSDSPTGHLDLVANLPVHLDDELERLALEQRGVGLRPGLLPECSCPSRSQSSSATCGA